MARFMQQFLSHKKGKSSFHDNNSNNGKSICIVTRDVVRTLAISGYCLTYNTFSSHSAQKSNTPPPSNSLLPQGY
jgi:hypothetical protein